MISYPQAADKDHLQHSHTFQSLQWAKVWPSFLTLIAAEVMCFSGLLPPRSESPIGWWTRWKKDSTTYYLNMTNKSDPHLLKTPHIGLDIDADLIVVLCTAVTTICVHRASPPLCIKRRCYCLLQTPHLHHRICLALLLTPKEWSSSFLPSDASFQYALWCSRMGVQELRNVTESRASLMAGEPCPMHNWMCIASQMQVGSRAQSMW